MAISLKATGAWVENTAAAPTVTLAGSPAAGDRYYIWSAWKNFATTASMTAAWTEVTEFTEGSTTAGNGTGSMKVACWYRDWQSGDGDPVLTYSTATNLLAGIVYQLWQKGAGETFRTPTFHTGAKPLANPSTVNATTSGAVPDGAVVMCMIGFCDDCTTMTRSTTAISASPALTWNGNHVESPATHRTSLTGNDGAADLGHRFVTIGHASTTLDTTVDNGGNRSGAILWVVQGVTPKRFINKQLSVAVKRAGFY